MHVSMMEGSGIVFSHVKKKKIMEISGMVDRDWI